MSSRGWMGTGSETRRRKRRRARRRAFPKAYLQAMGEPSGTKELEDLWLDAQLSVYAHHSAPLAPWNCHEPKEFVLVKKGSDRACIASPHDSQTPLGMELCGPPGVPGRAAAFKSQSMWICKWFGAQSRLRTGPLLWNSYAFPVLYVHRSMGVVSRSITDCFSCQSLHEGNLGIDTPPGARACALRRHTGQIGQSTGKNRLQHAIWITFKLEEMPKRERK